LDKQGLNTPAYKQYPQMYSVPAKPATDKQSAVNVYINAQPQHPYAAYPYYYPYYYPYPYYIPQKTEQSAAPLASQSINQAPPAVKPKEEKPEKKLTPLTPELLHGLQAALTGGQKEDRYKAIARVVNLMNEDREQRKNSELMDLIKIGQHQNQPNAVKEVANAAATSIKYNTPIGKNSEEDNLE